MTPQIPASPAASAVDVRRESRYVDSEQELRDVIADELSRVPLDKLVVMGGHFMLFQDEDSKRLVPGVVEEQSSDVMRRRVAGRVGIFPEYTWRLAAELVREHTEECSDARLLLLVNDWQYVPADGRPASALRAEFFEGLTALPAGYLRILAQTGLGPERILPSRKHPLAFPETWLKYRFQKTADRFVKQGRLEKRFLAEGGTDTEVAFLDEDGNYTALISCGVTGCAGEITEMVSEVYKAGYRTVVVFAPGECLEPVRTGVQIALNLYDLPGMVVLVTDPGGSGEGSAEEIFAGMVSVTTFRS